MSTRQCTDGVCTEPLEPPVERAVIHTKADIPAIAHIVERLCKEQGACSKVVFNITLAIDELVTNTFEHGLEAGEDRPVYVSFWIEENDFIARTEDFGIEYNCTQAKAPELDKPLEERDRPVGGMGIHLVKSLMDGFIYRREDERNLITIRKRLRNNQESAS